MTKTSGPGEVGAFGLRVPQPIPTGKKPLSEAAAAVADEVIRMQNDLVEKQGVINRLDHDRAELNARINQLEDELVRVREKADYYQRTTITLTTRLADAGKLVAACLEEVGQVKPVREVGPETNEHLFGGGLFTSERPVTATELRARGASSADMAALAAAITGHRTHTSGSEVRTEVERMAHGTPETGPLPEPHPELARPGQESIERAHSRSQAAGHIEWDKK